MEGQIEVKYRCKRCRLTQIILVRDETRIRRTKSCPYCTPGRMRVEPKANRIGREGE